MGHESSPWKLGCTLYDVSITMIPSRHKRRNEAILESRELNRYCPFHVRLANFKCILIYIRRNDQVRIPQDSHKSARNHLGSWKSIASLQEVDDYHHTQARLVPSRTRGGVETLSKRRSKLDHAPTTHNPVLNTQHDFPYHSFTTCLLPRFPRFTSLLRSNPLRSGVATFSTGAASWTSSSAGADSAAGASAGGVPAATGAD